MGNIGDCACGEYLQGVDEGFDDVDIIGDDVDIIGEIVWVNIVDDCHGGRIMLSYLSTIVLSRSYILPSLHLQGKYLHRPEQPLAMITSDMNKQEYGLVNDEEWLGISLE